MVIATIFAILLSIVTTVSAHETGGPEYLMVNREYAPANPLLSYAEPTTIEVGEDVAPTIHAVGEALVFAVDLERYPSEEGKPAPEFGWDFGDESQMQVGPSVSHTYQNPGTYIVKLQINSQAANTVQIDILPTLTYGKLQPKISVDGTVVENPVVDVVTVQPAKKVTFRAQATGSAQYQWDFGNGEGAQGETATTRYNRDDYFPVVVLRAVDENGLWSDTYALLDLPPTSANPIIRFWYVIVDFLTSLTG
jgi:hypothetical protein